MLVVDGNDSSEVVVVTDLLRLAKGPEGQYLERKSLFEGEPAKKRQRDRRAVRDHIAEVVAAFANADGGVLVLGVDDDGTVTGHAYDDDVIADMLLVPERRLQPPGKAGQSSRSSASRCSCSKSRLRRRR